MPCQLLQETLVVGILAHWWTAGTAHWWTENWWTYLVMHCLDCSSVESSVDCLVALWPEGSLLLAKMQMDGLLTCTLQILGNVMAHNYLLFDWWGHGVQNKTLTQQNMKDQQ